MQPPEDTTRPGRTPPAPGREPGRVGEFEIRRLLGRGGFGAVYEAYQPSLNRRVAIKVLHEGVFGDELDRRRFDREIRVASALSHPNVVPVYQRGTSDGHAYLVMPLVSGGTLARRIRAEREARAHRRSETWIGQVLAWFCGAAEGLQHIHDAGIVHRDVKPQNLLISDDGCRLLLADFGLAHDPRASRITQSGDFMGTISTMAPEQFAAHRTSVDHRADIWALGACLYEALALRAPHEGDTEAALISAILMKPAPPIRRFDPRIPREAELVIERCLDRDVDRRPATAGAVAEDLRRITSGQPIRLRRAGLLRRAAAVARRHRAVTFAAVAAGLVVALATELRKGRDLSSELEASLRAADTSDRSPATLPRWPLLEPLLARSVREDAEGPLALLAARASSRVAWHVFAPGLDPLVEIDTTPLFPPPGDRPLLVEIHGKWDDGPWSPLAWQVRDPRDDRETRLKLRPSRAFPDGDRTPGFHAFEIRARFSTLAERGVVTPGWHERWNGAAPAPRQHALVAIVEEAPRKALLLSSIPPVPWPWNPGPDLD